MFDDNFKMDKTAFSICTFEEAAEQDKAYWLSKTPQVRLAALEYMRQMLYGYDPDTARIQRILTVVEPA
ncbi:MAG: hypothetical protein A2X61_02585 [Ignavibacteria bacterium GWB2_35_12]|nr:MAG: hypothetical protein A2X63_11365 [Ignavibacteria bacterium GWA2_35_8]OGU42464.1 MAG: hypothetical protein A2X61_02585 [Ignavibacteria bacterium GWB2_35_12]OGU96633.1 MAG: hypothetical protein A2220_12165 [Ignavibacteria bacterium RIFOXYA2_FULL_35_10]OGV24244.1 MAG: hypothetical protein A2475_08510 [Ignavibacteria bacterium RIFOXYC2_FULL_35_21]